MTWGSGEDGCLGHGDTEGVGQARVVEDLVGCTVTQIACGAAHVMALTSKDLLVRKFDSGLNDILLQCNNFKPRNPKRTLISVSGGLKLWNFKSISFCLEFNFHANEHFTRNH